MGWGKSSGTLSGASGVMILGAMGDGLADPRPPCLASPRLLVWAPAEAELLPKTRVRDSACSQQRARSRHRRGCVLWKREPAQPAHVDALSQQRPGVGLLCCSKAPKCLQQHTSAPATHKCSSNTQALQQQLPRPLSPPMAQTNAATNVSALRPRHSGLILHTAPCQ
jgi:hypothetical protein